MSLAAGTYAVFTTTEGKITVRLFETDAPITVKNFIELAEGGKESLKRGELGRPRQLGAEQERDLGKVLMAGALAAGYPTELWTLPRIGKIITQQFGVEYSTGHLWHLLRRMGFSCQKPEKRAIQRNEPEIVRWKRHGWPALKKKPSERTAPSSSSTNPD